MVKYKKKILRINKKILVENFLRKGDRNTAERNFFARLFRPDETSSDNEQKNRVVNITETNIPEPTGTTLQDAVNLNLLNIN